MRPRLHCAIAVVLLLTGCGLLPATDIRCERYTIEQGLSQSTVAAIVQDRQGFLWIGTQDGLNRFDGYSFTVFRQGLANSSGLSSDSINALAVTADGRLWIGNSAGLDVYDPATYRWQRAVARPGAGGAVYALLVDGRDRLWCGSKAGLAVLEPGAGRWRACLPAANGAAPASGASVRALCQDRRGQLWVGTDGGVLRFDPQSGERQLFRAGGAGRGPSDDAVRALLQDRRGRIWVGTKLGLDRFDPRDGSWSHIRGDPADDESLGSPTIRALLEDRAGAIWVGSKAGLNRVDIGSGRWQRFVHDEADPGSLSDENIRTLFQDRSGVIWVGTWGGGLNALNPTRLQWGLHRAQAGRPGRLNDGQVRAICRDGRGILWVGTVNGGLNRLDPGTSRWRAYRHRPRDAGSIAGDTVRAIAADRSGGLWAATYGGGVCRLDLATDRWARFARGGNGPSSEFVTSLLIDRGGSVWVGTDGRGIDRFDVSAGRWRNFRQDPVRADSLNSDVISCLFEDRSGTIWAGSEHGLNRFDRDGARWRPFARGAAVPVHAIHQDMRGGLWLGTARGLCRIDPASGRWHLFTTRDGLPNDYIYGVLEDRDGRLWVSTNRGLSRFDPQRLEFKNFDAGDGLQSDEFNGGAYFAAPDGTLYFGGIRGFNAFDPGAIRADVFVPPVIITGFRAFERPVEISRQAGRVPRIVLRYDENFFAFEFAALDFRNPARNRYAYKLEGLDREWVECGSRRYASYTQVSSGDYLFRVRGSSADGVWNMAGTALRVRVVPPFWRTVWFIGPLLLAAGAALLFFARQRRRVLTQRLEKEALEREMKLKADYTAMMVHDLRTPLTCILAYADILRGSSRDPQLTSISDSMLQSSETMLRLINDMLDISKFEAGKMIIHPGAAGLEQIFRASARQMKPLLDKAGLLLDTVFEPLPPLRVDAVRIGQVMGNLLSNAIKFSPRGGAVAATLNRVTEEGRSFQEFAVIDMGPGVSLERRQLLFDKYAQVVPGGGGGAGTGLGLAVSRLIVEAHGGRIGYRERPGGGSIFFFRVPE